jgi:peroxiredoxin (alkyl hydroperoxide reductase subunit C)
MFNVNNHARQITVNDLPVGRSVDETIRLIKAFQFTVCNDVADLMNIISRYFQDKHGEVCPVNWSEGSKTMKPDPKGSLEYFSSVDAPNGDANGVAKKRPRVE